MCPITRNDILPQPVIIMSQLPISGLQLQNDRRVALRSLHQQTVNTLRGILASYDELISQRQTKFIQELRSSGQVMGPQEQFLALRNDEEFKRLTRERGDIAGEILQSETMLETLN